MGPRAAPASSPAAAGVDVQVPEAPTDAAAPEAKTREERPKHTVDVPLPLSISPSLSLSSSVLVSLPSMAKALCFVGVPVFKTHKILCIISEEATKKRVLGLLLLMINILHDLIYQHCRNHGCRVLNHQQQPRTKSSVS